MFDRPLTASERKYRDKQRRVYESILAGNGEAVHSEFPIAPFSAWEARVMASSTRRQRIAPKIDRWLDEETAVRPRKTTKSERLRMIRAAALEAQANKILAEAECQFTAA